MTAKRLLAVDDEVEFGRFVARVARGLDYVVEVTTTAEDFMAAFQRFDPDVIVLDMIMPRMDGVELIRWLGRAKCRARIVIISGFNPAYAKMAELLGDAWGILSVITLAKPVSLIDLRAALEPAGLA